MRGGAGRAVAERLWAPLLRVRRRARRWIPFLPLAAALTAPVAVGLVVLIERAEALGAFVAGLVLVFAPPFLVLVASVYWRRFAPLPRRARRGVVLYSVAVLVVTALLAFWIGEEGLSALSEPGCLLVVGWVLLFGLLFGFVTSWRKSLRWLAVGPVAGATLAMGTAQAWLWPYLLQRPASLQPLAAWIGVTVAAPAALYLGVRTAPRSRGHRRLATLLLLALALVILLGFVVEADSFSWRLLALAASVLFGAGLAWVHAEGLWRRSAAATGGGRRYKGTAPFQDDPLDRKIFYGREVEGRSFLHLVLAERLVVLFAKSGLGKSSLINAGLVEPLRGRGFLPLVARVSDRTKGPVGSVVDGVLRAVAAAGAERVGPAPSGLVELLAQAELWSPVDEPLRPVLVVDQFEELFTLYRPEERTELVRQLAELVQAGWHGPAGGGEAQPVKVVLALREDFLAHLEDLARVIPAILHHRFRLGPLTREAAKAAIVGPAELDEPDAPFATGPFTYREEAVERILDFLARQRHGEAMVFSDEVEPVQLQLVCQYLEEAVRHRQAKGEGRVVVTAADLGGESKMQEVLEGFYDRVLTGIASPLERLRVRRLCEKRLISSGGRRLTEDGEEIRSRYKLPQRRLDDLVDQRLLRAEPRLGGTFYELAHDRLVEPIRRTARRRLLRGVAAAAAAAAILTFSGGAWWAEEGRKRSDEAFVEQIMAEIPDPGDPEAVEAQLRSLAEERLELLEEALDDPSAASRSFGAIWLVAGEIARDFPRLRERADRVRRRVRQVFIDEHGPPDDQASRENNPRRLVAAPQPFLVQEHRVTRGELRPFPTRDVGVRVVDLLRGAAAAPDAEGRHSGDGEPGEERRRERDRAAPAPSRAPPLRQPDVVDAESVVDGSWFTAMEHAAWLGGDLPTEEQLRLAEEQGKIEALPDGYPERFEWCREREPDPVVGPVRCPPFALSAPFRVVWPAGAEDRRESGRIPGAQAGPRSEGPPAVGP